MFLAARMAVTNAAARWEPNPVVMSQPGRVGQPGTGPGETLPSALYCHQPAQCLEWARRMPRCVIHLRRGEAHTTAGAAARRSAVALSRREYARRHPHRESPRPALA